MTDRWDTLASRPRQLAWIRSQLEPGEYVTGIHAMYGGITAEMSRLTIGSPDGKTRELALRTYLDPLPADRAEELLRREATALTFLAATAVPSPTLVAVDPRGAESARPSLLMTFLGGRTALADNGIEARVPVLARQLVAIHQLRPADPPPVYEALTTPGTVIVPECGDAATWSAAIDVIRAGPPPYLGRFLHRDFQPGNVLFESASPTLTAVVDWQATSWGPADLDVAHCCTNLALLHGPQWGLRFVYAYEQAGGTLAAATPERRYWLVRDALAASEELREVSEPWRAAGRTDLTPYVVAARLNDYLTLLFDTLR